MGLEAVFQYVGLTTTLSFPLLITLSILPWDLNKCIEHWQAREKKYVPFFNITFWLFAALLSLACLFYLGGVFELVRTGGTYMGWHFNISPLLISSLGFFFSTIWIAFWFIPVTDSDFMISHYQAIALFFVIFAFFWASDVTKSAWFMWPLIILDGILWFGMWNYEEEHATVKYHGTDVS